MIRKLLKEGVRIMVRSTLFSLFLLVSISLEGNPMDREYHQLTSEQKRILQFAYSYGKEHDFGFSMAAIAWQESFVGDEIVPINLQDPSAGLWHKNINIALEESDAIPNNGLRLNMMAKRLIDNLEFAASLAVSDLEHWKEVRNGNWIDIWASYNAGQNYQSSKGQQYAYAIKNKIKILRRYLPFQ